MEYLPYEIEWQIQSYLDYADRIQCSLLSKHWREMLKPVLFETVQIRLKDQTEAFVDILNHAPSIGISIKKLILEIHSRADALYCTALDAIEQGYWKHLHSIHDQMAFSFEPSCLTQHYYAVVSAIRDRLSTVMLNMSSLPPTRQPHYFQFPFITPETRFHAAVQLTCISEMHVAFQSVDDALTLCPNATDVMMTFWSLDPLETEVEPNQVVKKLKVSLYDSLLTGIDYIRQKFAHLDQLTLIVQPPDEFDSSDALVLFDMPLTLATQLAQYLQKMDAFEIVLNGFINTIELLHIFTTFAWPGKMTIEASDTIMLLTYHRSEPTYAELYLDTNPGSIDITEASMRDYLGQLDDLQIHLMTHEHMPLLPYCTHLKYLSTECNTELSYHGPPLPITRLDLVAAGNSLRFLTQFTQSLPHLSHLYLRLGTSERLHIDTPLVSFQVLCIRVDQRSNSNEIHIHLIRSGTETFYRHVKDQLFEMEASEFKELGPDMERGKIKVVCKDIKQIGIFWKKGSRSCTPVLFNFY
ncbi:hypothetical protein EDC96DRAFT_519873 [Choanephora cucurbitarum]|nr:hypothetical protein EDC96DRAFT_519873 [Choanephora cucurbitarum]